MRPDFSCQERGFKKKKSPSRSLEDLSFVSAGRDVFKILSKPHSYEIFDLKRLLKKSGCN